MAKLIADIAEGNETTKFPLTKVEILGLMNYVTAKCIANLSCLAAAEEAEDYQPNEPTEEQNVPVNDVNNKDHKNVRLQAKQTKRGK